MSNLVFDIEADGLDPTKIHCIVAQDVDTMDVFTVPCSYVHITISVVFTATGDVAELLPPSPVFARNH